MDYAVQYRKLDVRSADAEGKAERFRRIADDDKWSMAQVANDAIDCGEYTRSSFAKAVGRTPNTIRRQVTIWQKYAHLSAAQRPSYTEAYDATVGDDRPFGAPSKMKATAQDVETARRVLANPRLAAEVLTPAAIAQQVADRDDVARAIARNDSARESVEEHGTAHRARNYDPERENADRIATHNAVQGMAKALGIPEDEATGYLNGAASDIAHAIVACEQYGIEYPEEEARAIERIERHLRAYKAQAPLNDADREWAASMGVTL